MFSLFLLRYGSPFQNLYMNFATGINLPLKLCSYASKWCSLINACLIRSYLYKNAILLLSHDIFLHFFDFEPKIILKTIICHSTKLQLQISLLQGNL